ncbi:hypothetical protein [Pedobacter sp. SYP-B3415]|uniref:hypothetical protein n=1 Tax=Pedobacter sp. SYP-B3415 TaxID=2496641 RepID=UPI00101CE421|nr:hypothetical protein [Pedobacter sp. SYP-B3415]
MKTKHIIMACLLVCGLAACSQDGKQQSSSPTLTGTTGDSSAAPTDTTNTSTSMKDTASVVGDTSATQ